MMLRRDISGASAPSDSDDVLVGHRAPHRSDPALRQAVLEAQTRRRPLRLITTWNPYESLTASSFGTPLGGPVPLMTQGDPAGQARAESQKDLTAALRHANAEDCLAVSTVVRAGPPGPVLAELSGRGALLVIGANERPRWQNALIRSPVGMLLRKSRTPVMLIPRDWQPGAFRRVVLWFDPRTASRGALRWAHDEATRHGCPLDVLAVVADGSPQDVDGAAMRAARLQVEAFVRDAGPIDPQPPIHARVTVGRPAPALVAAMGRQQLLVVQATPSSSLLGWLRANVAEQCASQARSATVVLPSRM